MLIRCLLFFLLNFSWFLILKIIKKTTFIASMKNDAEIAVVHRLRFHIICSLCRQLFFIHTNLLSYQVTALVYWNWWWSKWHDVSVLCSYSSLFVNIWGIKLMCMRHCFQHSYILYIYIRPGPQRVSKTYILLLYRICNVALSGRTRKRI